MKPPISYFGGKSRLAPLIASLLPPHDRYVELFCGSAAVLFAKTPARFEIINDIDGELVNFFRVLRDHTDELLAGCELTPYAREEFRAALLPTEDPIERARRFWVRSTQAFGGRVNEHDSWSSSPESTTCRARTVRNRLGRFRLWAERLALVAVEHADAVDVVDRHAVAGAAIYVDPPYLHEARSDYHRSNGYRHEFGSEEQHRRLAEALHESPATIVVSSYPHPLYDELYGEWHQLEVVRHNDVQKRRKGQARSRTREVLWINRPVRQQLKLVAAPPPTTPPSVAGLEGAG